MYGIIKRTNDFFFIIIISLSILIDKTTAAAGRCYQCNSRNPLCQIEVNSTLQIDGTPCNGQCYIRLNRDDEHTIYRGCSWEHGFMKPQETNILILEGNSIWTFCDTPYCNVHANPLLITVCYQPICNYLNFPDDCKLPHVDITCGLYCKNQLCSTMLVRPPFRNRKRFRILRNETEINV